jgi:hypothetical protein
VAGTLLQLRCLEGGPVSAGQTVAVLQPAQPG